MSQKFIKTTDEQTANKLIAEGLKLISHIGQVYTFLNESNDKFQFTETDKKKVIYSNILSI